MFVIKLPLRHHPMEISQHRYVAAVERYRRLRLLFIVGKFQRVFFGCALPLPDPERDKNRQGKKGKQGELAIGSETGLRGGFSHCIYGTRLTAVLANLHTRWKNLCG